MSLRPNCAESELAHLQDVLTVLLQCMASFFTRLVVSSGCLGKVGCSPGVRITIHCATRLSCNPDKVSFRGTKITTSGGPAIPTRNHSTIFRFDAPTQIAREGGWGRKAGEGAGYKSVDLRLQIV